MTAKEAGTKGAQGCAGSGRTSADTASAVGISARKVEQARTVIDHAPEEVRAAVESGDMSINAAYQATQKERKRQVIEPPPETENIQSELDQAADIAAKREMWLDNLRQIAAGKGRIYWPLIAELMRQVADELETQTKEQP